MTMWGKYGDENRPRVHFDPLASFTSDGDSVGYRIHVVPSRGSRPRDHKLPSAKKDQITSETFNNETKESSVLFRITQGIEKAVFISADDIVLGDPDDQAKREEMTDYNALAVMNKFSPLNINTKEAAGTALVIFPTTYIETLDDASINTDILRALKTATNHLLSGKSYRKDLRTPMVFFNIGPSSGASLKILHAQAYITTHAAGLLTYTFNQAFQSTDYCLTCSIANDSVVDDHLDQQILYNKLTVWEDEYSRLISPHAPIRPLSMRVIVKNHRRHIGELTADE